MTSQLASLMRRAHCQECGAPLAFCLSRETSVTRVVGASAFLKPQVSREAACFQVFCSKDRSHYNSRTLSGPDETALQELFVRQEAGLLP